MPIRHIVHVLETSLEISGLRSGCQSERFEAVRQQVDDPFRRAFEDAPHNERWGFTGDAPIALPHPDRADHVDEAVLIFQVHEGDTARGRRSLAVGNHPGELDALTRFGGGKRG